MNSILFIVAGLILFFGPSAKAMVCQDLFRSFRTEIFGESQSAVDRYFYTEIEATKVKQIEPGRSKYDVEPDFQIKRLDRMRIEILMQDFKLSRLEAVEVQALLRRYVKYPQMADLQAAIKAVREQKTLSRLNIERVKKSKFVLLLDIDGTLLDQDASFFAEGIHQTSFLVDGSKVNHVALNPGVLAAIHRARELGGSVVLFSRNTDALIWEILNSTEVQSGPLAGYKLADLVDGVFTSSHMMVPPELADRVGREELVGLLKKDLSILPNKNVLLLDDDVKYVLQKGQAIEVPKFDLDELKRSVRKSKYSQDDQDSFDSLASGSDDGRSSFLDRPASRKPVDGEYDQYGFSRSRGDSLRRSERSRESEMSKEELKALKSAVEEFNTIYEPIIQQMETLVKNIKRFQQLQKVYSPLGETAIELLMGTHEKYELRKHKPVDRITAEKMLEVEPGLIDQILSSKTRRPEPEKPTLGEFFNFFRAR